MSFKAPIRRILVIKNRAIGDTLLLTGVLRVLKKHRPNYQIHVVVRSPAGQLLEGLPYIDRLISTSEPKGRVDRLAYWSRMIRRLREKRYEFALNFHASFRTALVSKLLRTMTCVANHHELKGRNWFSDLKVPGRGKVKSIIDRDLDVLRALGIHATVDEAMPEVLLDATERKLGLAKLQSAFAQKYNGPIVFLGIGGSRATKRWHATNFADLMHRLATEYDASFVVCSVSEDQEWMAGFKQATQAYSLLHDRVAYFHDLPLRQVAGVMSHCDLYVGNDSGLKHLAVALMIKTFTFFGPESPLEWHPYDLKRHPYAFIKDMPCRTESGKHWCSIEVCDVHQHRCMRDLTTEQIWDSLKDLIQC